MVEGENTVALGCVCGCVVSIIKIYPCFILCVVLFILFQCASLEFHCMHLCMKRTCPHLFHTVCKTSVYEKWKCLMCVGWCQAFLVGIRRFYILLSYVVLLSNSAHTHALPSFYLSVSVLFFLHLVRSFVPSLYITKSNFLLNFKLGKANWKPYSTIRLLVSTLCILYFLISTCNVLLLLLYMICIYMYIFIAVLWRFAD